MKDTSIKEGFIVGKGNRIPPMSKRDRRLMHQAKERVETRSFLKWMFGLGIILSIAKTAVWFFTEDRGSFWPGYFMAGWGVMLLILCIIFIPSLSSKNGNKNNMKIMAEYEKLKNEEQNL